MIFSRSDNVYPCRNKAGISGSVVKIKYPSVLKIMLVLNGTLHYKLCSNYDILSTVY